MVSAAPTTAFMARTLGVFHISGGLGALLVVALPHWSGLRPVPVAALAAASIVFGAGLLVGGARIPALGFSGVLVISTGMVTGVSWAAGTGAGTAAAATLYVPLGLFAAMLLNRAALAAQFALSGLAYALVLAVEHQHGGPGQWLVTMATVITSSLVVRWLVEHTRRIARSDWLTGIDNRVAWDDRLTRQLAIAYRTNRVFTVAIADLDRFKEVNARLGHRGGDRLLVATAEAWRGQLRPDDGLARYGGDEFAVLFPDTDLDDAELVLQRLQATSDEGSFSAGLARWYRGESPDDLMGRADRALYRAKEGGRGRVVADRNPPAPDRPLAGT